MIDADRPRFAALITGYSEYYKQAVSSFSIDLYWRGLRNYDIAAIEQAFERHYTRTDREGAFMPKVNDLKIMLEGRSADQGAMAWAKVDRAVRTVGTYEDVVFDDALIHRCIADMGGWAWLGNQTDKEWPFIEKTFITRYQGYRMRGEQPAHVAILTGIGNSANATTGMPRLPAVMVGDPHACRRVAQVGSPLQLAGSGHLRLTSELLTIEAPQENP